MVDRLVEMRVSVEDYSPFLSELCMFRVYLHATVDETDQLTATFADFRLVLPQLEISVSFLTYLLKTTNTMALVPGQCCCPSVLVWRRLETAYRRSWSWS